MTTIKIIKAVKKKITDHHHGCCNCGGTPTAPAAPPVAGQPRQNATAQKKQG